MQPQSSPSSTSKILSKIQKMASAVKGAVKVTVNDLFEEGGDPSSDLDFVIPPKALSSNESDKINKTPSFSSKEPSSDESSKPSPMKGG
ncbi:MAG: hypothetical protein ACD_21C00034G0003 [uncultured bacterium]|nr:MAG: hypothetical protein ACD_21C00034G0003 [uncultured bacterium]